MEIVTAPIDALIPDPKNPREHSIENITAIRKSLERFGQVLPILVRNEDCQIVAGNGTVRAMKDLGWGECQVAVYDGNDAECRALSVALNRTAELAMWDDGNLVAVFESLRAIDFDGIGALGFDTVVMDDLVTKFHQESEGAMEIAIENLEEELEQECPRCKFRFPKK